MRKIISVLILSFFVFSWLPAQAADFYLPENENEPNVVISSSSTYSDLYTAAGNLTVNSNISGDLTGIGGSVTFDGKVEKSLLLAGGNMTLAGSVGDTARIAGGNYSISSHIGGDLALVGGNVTISDQAVIEKDLLVAAGNLILNGTVKGKARIAGSTVYINGKIEGDVRIRAAQKVTFGPNANISGKVLYYAPEAATFASGSNVPSVEFKMTEKKSYKNEMKALFSAAFLIKLLAWFFAGLLALRFFKTKIQEIFSEITTKPWTNLGMGLVWLICTPIVAVILFISFVGYYLGGLLVVLYVLGLLVANLVSALILGYLLAKYLNKNNEHIPDWQIIAMGVVVLTLLKLVPVIGWAATGVLFLVSLGGLVKIIRNQFSN